MSRFIMKLTFFLFLTVTPVFLYADETSDATKFLSDIYNKYNRSGYNFSGPGADTVLAPELFRLIKKDEENAHGENGYLDWDPICDCQDYEGLKVNKIFIIDENHKKYGKVFFKISETNLVVTLELVKIDNKWRIKDIITPTMPSLLKYLTDNLQNGSQ